LSPASCKLPAGPSLVPHQLQAASWTLPCPPPVASCHWTLPRPPPVASCQLDPPLSPASCKLPAGPAPRPPPVRRRLYIHPRKLTRCIQERCGIAQVSCNLQGETGRPGHPQSAARLLPNAWCRYPSADRLTVTCASMTSSPNVQRRYSSVGWLTTTW
jgi:hypothetical protein